MLHELGHAIGLLHEQTRPDRNSYVHILNQNVAPPMRSQFDIKNNEDVVNYGMSMPYDYRSVMHYGKTVSTLSHTLYVDQ